jgi:RecA-family ATPase
VSAAELQLRQFSETVAFIEGLILEGLGILGGKPKLGKSWWALRAALAIASGGVAYGNPERAVARASVLYLALEDGEKRLKNRLGMLLLPDEVWPNNLIFVTEWPRFDKGGIALLAEVIDRDGYRVVFIDTLSRVRGPAKGRDSYQDDSNAIAEIHDLVRSRPGLAIVIIHHNRKDDRPDDYIDALSGTTGITGVVDHIAVLQRGRGEADAVLHFTSRDAEEHDTAFKLEDGMWTELGDAAVYELTKARQLILYAMDELGGEVTNKELAEYLGKKPPTIIKQLHGLERDGLVVQDTKGGPWRRTTNPANSPNHDDSELGRLAGLGDLWDEEE